METEYLGDKDGRVNDRLDVTHPTTGLQAGKER